MNKKEISELRRRFSPDKNSIGHIYGCYVNTKKEIIAYLDESCGRRSRRCTWGCSKKPFPAPRERT